MAAEEEKRESAVCCLESQLSELRNDFQGERDALKDELDRERHERIQQAQDLDTYFRYPLFQSNASKIEVFTVVFLFESREIRGT